MRNFLTILEQRLDEQIAVVRQLPEAKVKATISDMILDIQLLLSRALRTKEKDVLAEIETRIENVRLLIKHHQTKELWNDQD